MVCLIIDPKYKNSVWCKNTLKSLTEQLRKNRIPFCEIFDECPKNVDAVFMIAADFEWIKTTIKQFNTYEIQPILICNQSEHFHGCRYNCISSDVNHTIKSVIEKLISIEKKHIAIYGVNTNSVSDIGKVDSFFSFSDNNFENIKIFNNDGSLSKCFEKIYPILNEFDAIICMNDFAAISLVRNLKIKSPEYLNHLSIISFAKTEISRYYKDYIISVDTDYEQYGKSAIFLYKSLMKYPYISNISISVARDINDTHKSSPVSLQSHNSSDSFYKDPELNAMLKIEKMLNLADYVDIMIINGLIMHHTLETISANSFLSLNAVKYRIKKILNECDITEKSQLAELLDKYLHNIEISHN